MTVAFTEVEAAARRPFLRAIALAFLLALVWIPTRGLAQPNATCSPSATRLCLGGNRFQAEVSWAAPEIGTGVGHSSPLTADTGMFWFFSSSNLELTVKVLDGRAVNRHFWVFYGGLSSVDYTLTLTDLQTGARAVYRNPPGHLGSGADVAAFNEEAPAAARLNPAVVSGVVAGEVAPVPAGAEIPVNVTRAGDQSEPAVAVAPDGKLMVAWSGGPNLVPIFRRDVFGRVYDAAGNPLSGEIRLSTTVSSSQERPKVAVNAAGQFMAVWTDDTTARGRLFDAAGNPLTGELTLGLGGKTRPAPDVTADPAGGFMIVWVEESPTFHEIIHWRRLDAHGQPLGADRTITAAGFVPPPRVATSPLGGFLIVWGEGFTSIDSFAFSNVWAQRLDAMGMPVGAVIKVNESDIMPLADPRPVFYADGSFSVLWTLHQLLGDVGNIFARRYRATGVPTSATVEFTNAEAVVATQPVAVALPSGDTWVLWFKNRLAQEPDGDVYSGIFDPSWNLKGSIFRVNTYSAGVQTNPAVATNALGDLVTAWASGDNRVHGLGGINATQDGDGFGVFAQRFTATTCADDAGQLCLGGRFRVAVQLTNPLTGLAGEAHAVPLTADTGAFWFFGPSNIELMVKVLDGRALNGHFWVFSGALTDVEYTITVTDTETHQSKSYHNPAHQLASRADTEAF